MTVAGAAARISTGGHDMLHEVVDRWAGRRPGGLALVDEAGALTWAELHALASRLRAQVSALGCGTVALAADLRAGGVALAAACSAEGVDAVLVSPLDGPRSAAAVVDEGAADVALGFAADGPVVLARRERFVGRAHRPGGPFVHIRTSGSTGRPKVAQHTWATLSAGVRVRDQLQGRRWLLGLPYSNMGGLAVLTSALWNGGALVLPHDFSPRAALRAIVAHAVDYVGCTPTFMRQVLVAGRPDDWRAATVRRVTLGGEIVDQPLLDALHAVLPDAVIAHHYGSTELGMLITVDDGKAGFPLARIDEARFRVVDGELQVKRPTTAMLSPAADAGDGWISTCDRVEVVGDRVHFRGRRGDEINVGGFKVAPAPLEEAIRALPGIAEARVVAHRSSLAGNLLKAVLWLHEGADAAEARAGVERALGERFPAHMVPRLFEFPSSLQLTASQKLARESL